MSAGFASIEDVKAFAAATAGPPNTSAPSRFGQSLKGLKSWEAVIEFALAAEAITLARAEELREIDWATDFSAFVPPDAVRVTDAHAMRQVPAGAFIAFIQVDEPNPFYKLMGRPLGRRHLIHAMISLGDGNVAGTNNKQGIGIGNDSRWEILNLADLCRWFDGSVTGVTLGTQKSRRLHVRYRPLADFQAASSRVSTSPSIENLTLDLVKRVSILPMDGGASGTDWTLVDAATHSAVSGKAVPAMRLVQLAANANEGGAWKLTSDGVGRSKQIYFLPWWSKCIVKLTVGDGHNVFATSALSGCSVFTIGDETAPTVFHAGINGALAAPGGPLKSPPFAGQLVDPLDLLFANDPGNADKLAMINMAKENKPEFWRLLLYRLAPAVNQGQAPGWSEVNKQMYVADTHGSTARARAVVDAVKATHRADDITWGQDTGMPWGSYLGFSVNGKWSMYLQENITFSYTRVTPKETYRASFPIALRQVFPPGHEGTNLIDPVPDRIVNPFTPSDTVRRL